LPRTASYGQPGSKGRAGVGLYHPGRGDVESNSPAAQAILSAQVMLHSPTAYLRQGLAVDQDLGNVTLPAARLPAQAPHEPALRVHRVVRNGRPVVVADAVDEEKRLARLVARANHRTDHPPARADRTG